MPITKGTQLTPEHRAAISRGRSGLTFTPEHRKAIRESRLGTTTSDDAKKSLSDALTGIIRSDETRARMSRAAKERWKNPEYRAKLALAQPEAQRRAWVTSPNTGPSLQALRSNHASETRPERLTRECLEEHGVAFEQRVTIDRCTVDFLIGLTVIECDGNYWHGPKRPQQQITDRRRDSFLSSVGYKVVRLWESDIITDVEKLLRKEGIIQCQL